FAKGDITIDIGGNATVSGRTIDLAANHTATWASTSQPFSLANGAVFNNPGLFDVQGDARIDNGGGDTSQFVNNGAFRKSAGAGVTSVRVSFNNVGTVEVQAGTLTFNGSLTNLSGGTLTGGSWIVHGNATLNTPSSVTTNQAAVTLDGANSLFPTFGPDVTNGAGALFPIQTGSIFAAAAFTNVGAATIGTGSTLATTTGNYTQT